MKFPRWLKCTCGRLHWAKSQRVASAALARCRSGHVRPKFLKLRRARMTVRNTLVVMLSHEGARHHHRLLAEEWRKSGFTRQLVKYGYAYGASHGPTKIRGNRLTMYNWRFRWLPAICSALAGDRGIRHVVACEGNAFFDGCAAATITRTEHCCCFFLGAMRLQDASIFRDVRAVTVSHIQRLNHNKNMGPWTGQ